MKKIGLYIHIPFCKQKCNYCDFYSLSCTSKIDEYINAIKTQLKIISPLYSEYEIDTAFIGGGTPSLLEEENFNILAQAIKNNLNLTQGAEFTLEANPGTLTKEKLLAYKKAGINRISIGLQSTDDTQLKALGRIHSLADFENSYNLARKCGFDNISIDLMYSLPNQTKKQFIETLEKAISYNPEHISAYSLKIEENTPFYKIKDKLSLPSEDEEYQMYLSLCATLEKSGYKQYEISNFAKDGKESKHNLKYWLSQEFLGIGPSAHSFINGERYYYSCDLNEYINILKEGKLPTKIVDKIDEDSSYTISKSDEYVMLRLRLSDGVGEEEYKKLFGKELIVKYPKLEKYCKEEYMKKEKGHFFFTPKGFFVSNYILTDILSFE